MKNAFLLLLLGATISLSSCGNGGQKITNLLAIPVGDSVTKGSIFQITFNNTSSDSEFFYITDLTINNSPVYAMSAANTMNPVDSFWTGTVQLIDYQSKQIAMNLTVTHDSTSILPYGNYYISTNTSTFTDYSQGENRNYSISTGSLVNYTAVNSIYVEGTFSLNLLYNYRITQAIGYFKIFK